MEFEKYISKSARPLPVFLLLDTSGSMAGYKIKTLNNAVREMIVDFQNERMTEVALNLCVITFGGSANVHTELAPLKNVEFANLTASGMTPMGGALKLASNIINDKEKVSSKGYRPVVVLVSDGMPNDSWQQPLEEFLTGKRTSKCEKWALGIGEDCDFNVLKQFINDPERPVFDASAAKEITNFFKFVTLSTIARSKSQNPNIPIDLDEIAEDMEEELPNFKFGLTNKT